MVINLMPLPLRPAPNYSRSIFTKRCLIVNLLFIDDINCSLFKHKPYWIVNLNSGVIRINTA